MRGYPHDGPMEPSNPMATLPQVVSFRELSRSVSDVYEKCARLQDSVSSIERNLQQNHDRLVALMQRLDGRLAAVADVQDHLLSLHVSTGFLGQQAQTHHDRQMAFAQRLDGRLTTIAMGIGDLQCLQEPTTAFDDCYSELTFGWKYRVSSTAAGHTLVEVNVDRDAVLLQYLRHSKDAAALLTAPEWQVTPATTSVWKQFLGERAPDVPLTVQYNQAVLDAQDWAKQLCLRSFAQVTGSQGHSA